MSVEGDAMARYAVAQDGQWIQPVRRGYKMACCDCGLVHKLDFRIKKARVQFAASRDNPSNRSHPARAQEARAAVGHSGIV